MKVPWTERQWRRVLVYGLGSSGRAASRLLVEQGVSVVAVDRRPRTDLDLEGLENSPDIELILGTEPATLPAGIDGVVLSPGVPIRRPLVREAKAEGLAVVSEIELASIFVNGPIVGITGSNGKSTTTAMTGEILRAAGSSVEICGNIGVPLSSRLAGPSGRVFVIELSSFQLETVLTLRPRVAALLNISADHLDRHGNETAYVAAKSAIFACQHESDIAILNADDPIVRDVAVTARRRYFSRLKRVEDGCYLEGDAVVEARPGALPRQLFERGQVGVGGLHNLENAMAASLAAASLGADAACFGAALTRFQGLPHRMERVATIDGVEWLNDSKGTNVGAVLKSLAGMKPGAVHLILGGRSKGADFSPLLSEIVDKAVWVYLIGEASSEIARVLPPTVGAEMCGDLDRAVAAAARRAKPGQAVLLSPACSSFDQYGSFGKRGEHFRHLVRGLEGARDG